MKKTILNNLGCSRPFASKHVWHSLARYLLAAIGCMVMSVETGAQTYDCYVSTDNCFMQKSRVKATSKCGQGERMGGLANVGQQFKAWGSCFNELGWDALQLLPQAKREEMARRLFAPDGDLGFTRGRFSMGANDYARGWYCCDSVAGDFTLKYFNINRDRETLIPYIKMAQRVCPEMTFWMSPWSPPSWMKINQDYPVRSSRYSTMDPRKDFLLYEDVEQPDKRVFPRQLSTHDYLIQDPRYLQCYADMFCRFIDEYAKEGIGIDMVMYQNEAWSYTPYPGCPWTANGIIRFNTQYLAPTLKRHHPEVRLWLGTINTNRREVVDKIVGDSAMQSCVEGVAFQWEGGQRLPEIHKRYPQLAYMCSESECGRGTMDWRAAEHTFHLINHYLGNGCEEYTLWNPILADSGTSPWGWRQNALIQVDSQTHEARLTPEYYAYMHYSHFIRPGSAITCYRPTSDDRLPVLVAKNGKGKQVIVMGNLGDNQKRVCLPVGKRWLSVEMKAHSFCTLVER